MYLATPISEFVKQQRKRHRLSQKEFSLRAGVGLRFLRELEQGKPSLRLDKVNQVLQMFGHQCGPIPANLPANLNDKSNKK